jgi:antibiotic biosynthesis monooxygenase (ABM) superfamily enzyme
MEQPVQPKKWKFALLIWCFIYPLITLLSMFLLPQLVIFPAPIRTLIMTLILVPLMAYFYIPLISKRFFVWLRK